MFRIETAGKLISWDVDLVGVYFVRVDLMGGHQEKHSIVFCEKVGSELESKLSVDTDFKIDH